MRISYCVTCKNRLWQLKETLAVNLEVIRAVAGAEIVLLDYHSEDGLFDYIQSNFMDSIESQKLRYYRLKSKAPYFDMSYAKNVSHRLAGGDILFNLDADNFIGTTVPELLNLPVTHILVSKMIAGTDTGRCGRIGIHADMFHKLRGYNELIFGMANDDGDFVYRAMNNKMRLKQSQDLSIPIPNSLAEKYCCTDPMASRNAYEIKIGQEINIAGYGRATVVDFYGNERILSKN